MFLGPTACGAVVLLSSTDATIDVMTSEDSDQLLNPGFVSSPGAVSTI